MRSHAIYRDWGILAVVSLVLGPLLMSVGDLIHPKESADAALQAAVIIEHPSRWYAAHLMLFFGILILIPGILALSRLTIEQSQRVGYAARVLVLVGVAAFAAVFAGEMLIGRYASDGADVSAATELLETFESVWVLGAVMIGGIAFFAGVAAFAVPLVKAGGEFRWPAALYILGAILILAEITTALVQLSQLGNVVILVASVWFVLRILHSDRSANSAEPALPELV